MSNVKEQLEQKLADLTKQVDGRCVTLSIVEMNNIIGGLNYALDYIETSDEMKDTPEDILNIVKQNHTDLIKKLSDIREEQLTLLKEERTKIFDELKELK